MMRLADRNPMQAVRRLELAGYCAIALLFGGVGVWASTAHIAGAVIAPGSLVVRSNVKKVQHPTGGVVAEIAVHDGDMVKAGQVVIRLDDTVARATVGVVQVQLDELEARLARLVAERDDVDHVTFPSALLAREGDPQIANTLAGERKLFESRRMAKIGQRSQLEQRIVQSKQEILGLEAQQAAKEQEISLIEVELKGVNELWDKNLVAITRLMQLRRDRARLSGERGQYIAEIARARGKINETELQIIQLDKDFSTDVLKDLRDAQGKIAELTERLVAAQDQLKRVNIVAPQDGVVDQLSVHTVGGVIANGEVLMQIVPRNDELIIEAKVEPRDIDQVTLGANAVVRILAGEGRVNPDLTGNVILVSADLSHDRPGAGVPERSYYMIRISLPQSELERLNGLTLLPGMQAEAFVQTYPRTPLQYMIKPLSDQMARVFRER
jgi:HlyD family secretion protein